jgi:hypothetical protein
MHRITNHKSLVRPRSIDQQWLREQLETVVEWTLEIAGKPALRDAEDVDAIDRVKQFMRKYMLGQRAEVPVNDVLATLGILISGIYIEDERTALSVLAPLKTMLQEPSELPAMFRVRSIAAARSDGAQHVERDADDRNGEDRDDVDADDDLDADDYDESDDADNLDDGSFHSAHER